jgi:TPR repeat protein
MRNLRTPMLGAFSLSVLFSCDAVEAQAIRPLDPQAAQQYVSDSEKAESGDPDAAYRLGEAFESGRLGGLKDLRKALTFYRLAAENGHQQAAERVSEIEAELGETAQKPPDSLGH